MPSKLIARIAALTTALIVVILASSAYLRLSATSGGCAQDDVACAEATANEPGLAQRVARAAHRISASVVAVLVLLVGALAWLRREGTPETRWVAVLLVVLTVFLAALGAAAGSSYAPAVKWGNVIAGNAMAAAAWWLYARNRRARLPEAAMARSNAGWGVAALALSLALLAWAVMRSAAPLSVGLELTKSLAVTLALLACVWLAADVSDHR